MSSHLERDLLELRQHVLAMGGLAEEALRSSCAALVRMDERRLGQYKEIELEIDRLQLSIDEECLKVLALHQPVAGDLRFITSAMKICNDLERIGDLAVNIANRVEMLVHRDGLNDSLVFEVMVECTTGMLRDALDAFVNSNSKLARDVTQRDDVVDDANAQNFKVLKERMMKDPSSVDTAVALLSVSRNIERIADLATNIAEDVVFMVEARDIRHPGLEQTSD